MTRRWLRNLCSDKVCRRLVIRSKNDAGEEEMKSAVASCSPNPESGDDCFQEDNNKILLDQAIAGMLTKACVFLDVE